MVSPTSSHAASPMSTSGRLHAPHLPPVVLATAQGSEQTETLTKARAFAEPLIAGVKRWTRVKTSWRMPMPWPQFWRALGDRWPCRRPVTLCMPARI